MPKFIVKILEVHTQDVEIEAGNYDAAIKAVEDGEGDYTNMEYSHTLSWLANHWSER